MPPETRNVAGYRDWVGRRGVILLAINEWCGTSEGPLNEFSRAVLADYIDQYLAEDWPESVERAEPTTRPSQIRLTIEIGDR